MQPSPVQISREKSKLYQFLGKKGRVVSFTSIAVAPQGLERRVPYVVAVVDFGGKRATVGLTDISPDKAQIGMRVLGVMRKLFEPDEEGVIPYGVKCVPLGE